MPTIDDLIDTALEQQPTQFASVFNNIMGEKAAEAIDAMRTSVAQGIYASEDELEPEDLDDEEDDDFEDEEDEISESEMKDALGDKPFGKMSRPELERRQKKLEREKEKNPTPPRRNGQ